MNIINILNQRYATKIFDNLKKIDQENLNILLDSIQLAPTSYGLQPFKYIIISDEQIKQEIKPIAYGQNQIVDCSHLIAFCINTKFSENDIDEYIDNISKIRGIEKSNLSGFKSMMIGSLINGGFSNNIENWMKNQLYITLGFLLYTAGLLGIDSCAIEGFDPTKLDKFLSLEEKNIKSVVLCALGYRGNDSYASLPKVRKQSTDLFDII